MASSTLFRQSPMETSRQDLSARIKASLAEINNIRDKCENEYKIKHSIRELVISDLKGLKKIFDALIQDIHKFIEINFNSTEKEKLFGNYFLKNVKNCVDKIDTLDWSYYASGTEIIYPYLKEFSSLEIQFDKAIHQYASEKNKKDEEDNRAAGKCVIL